MKRLLLSTAAVVIFASGSAIAADMPVKARSHVYGWTGCYIGASGGWARAEHDLSTLVPADSNMIASARTAITNTGNVRLSDDNWIAGGQAGCNFQLTHQWVLGAEVDFSGTGLKSERDTGEVVEPVSGVRVRSIDSVNVDWLATLRARLGWAVTPQALIYATGGGAFARINANKTFSWDFPGDPCPVVGTLRECHVGGTRETAFGWTVGGGLEWAFAHNWSVKAEYLFVQLGEVNYRTVNRGFPTIQWADHFADTQLHIARVGINYRFGGPVVARY